MDDWQARDGRYGSMTYRRCGSSGLRLPELSLGLWLNFGTQADDASTCSIVLEAFDNGITHFDLANNYGPPPGAAEQRFGTIVANNLRPYRDELVISSKAGYLMWNGPYGEGGSRKHLIASCDQSLKRMGLEYLDIFYHHRPDPATPLEETMGALAQLVRSGKALYAGISNYHPAEAVEAIRILKSVGCPFVLNQVRYSMLDRWVEREHLLTPSARPAWGPSVFPLAQGLLTDKYLNGNIPAGSRRPMPVFTKGTDHIRVGAKLNALNDIAVSRGQTLAQMAIACCSRYPVTSVLIGASSIGQLRQNIEAWAPTAPSAPLNWRR